MKTNFINYTHRRGGGVIQENWKQPFSPAVKLGDFVGGERARGLLRHFVWKVLIANLRGAETIFYSSTHRPTIRVYVRARVQFNSRVLLVDSNVSRLASHTHTHELLGVYTRLAPLPRPNGAVLSRLITNRPSKMEVCDGRFKLFRCAGPIPPGSPWRVNGRAGRDEFFIV